MWVLNFLPDWFFYIVLLAGVGGLAASYLMKFIPFVYMYRTPIQIGSVLAIVIGTFMLGAEWNDEEWRRRVAEMEQKVAAAELKSAEENVKIVTKIVNKIEIVRIKGEETIKYIDKEIIKYNDRCEIPNEVVDVLNNAAEQPK